MNKTTVEAKMYTALCADFGLKPEWLGKKVEERGTTYTIMGLNPRSKKFPVIMDNGVRFSADYLTALITNSVDKYKKEGEDAHEKKVEQARKNFPSYCEAYGIPATWLDKTFKHGRKVYTIVGIAVSARRFPVVTRDNDGKVLYFTTDLVRDCIAKETK